MRHLEPLVVRSLSRLLSLRGAKGLKSDLIPNPQHPVSLSLKGDKKVLSQPLVDKIMALFLPIYREESQCLMRNTTVFGER